jgi:hypothetical protein
MKCSHIPTDFLNAECERKKQSGATQNEQAEIEHERKLDRGRKSESDKRYAIRSTMAT